MTVCDPEVEIVSGHERAAAEHAVAGRIFSSGRIDRLHAAAHILETIAAPRPRIANHIMKPETIRREAANLARSRLPTEASELVIERIAPRKNRSFASAARGVFPFGITGQAAGPAGA